MTGPLQIGTTQLKSRLILGTGKYTSMDVMVRALEASGAGMITVAIGRVNFSNRGEKTLLDYIDRDRYMILPNTAGAYTAADAIRIARMARELGLGDFVKLEVIGDPKTLMPDTAGLLEATKVLVSEGFVVMPYTNDDVVVAKRLEDAGAACVMPLAAPIGSGRGIQNRLSLQFIMEAVACPLIVDAGVGTASDAAICMELGADGVLMNTAIAAAQDPVLMAGAMGLAVQAGRKAFLAGRMPVKEYATASSPQEGLTLKK
ncbi:MAG: thiazole synthase [Candidatus Omnitrophica bacterium]|nr:thiazole synthase [Candidatus Omnitrophota bacterium]MDD5671309.1 thiazole synthase [Candidatus Omnitrophota bacterium]